MAAGFHDVWRMALGWPQSSPVVGTAIRTISASVSVRSASATAKGRVRGADARTRSVSSSVELRQ